MVYCTIVLIDCHSHLLILWKYSAEIETPGGANTWDISAESSVTDNHMKAHLLCAKLPAASHLLILSAAVVSLLGEIYSCEHCYHTSKIKNMKHLRPGFFSLCLYVFTLSLHTTLFLPEPPNFTISLQLTHSAWSSLEHAFHNVVFSFSCLNRIM